VSRNSTEKLASIGIGALVVAFSGYAAFSSIPPTPRVNLDGGTEAGAAVVASSAPPSPTEMPIPSAEPVVLPSEREAPPDSDAGLAATAPRQVKFAVVLVTYAGSQDPKATRPKPAALALATDLAATAATDFHAAVQKGDSGSTDDAGRLPRGMIEPATEKVLFSLDVGAVSPVIDTPRGYWIVKRLE
jgi:hypothetical protein